MKNEAEEGNGTESEDDGEEKKSFAKHSFKKHQNLFGASNVHVDYDDEYDNEDESEDESEDEDEVHQENVFNQQNAFGMSVFAQPARRQPFGFNNGGMFGNNMYMGN